jgi:exonuclease I
METKDDLMDVLEYYMDNKSNFSNMLGKDILELLDYQKSTIEPQLNNTRIILLKQQTKMLEDVLSILNPEVYSYTLQKITNILKQGYYEVGDKQQLNEIRDMYQTKITNGEI